MAARKAGATKKLVTLVIDIDARDAVNDEAILKDGETVGYVSSGAYAHYVGKSLAMGYVPIELAAHGMNVHIEINGQMWPATVTTNALYDASGSRMRS